MPSFYSDSMDTNNLSSSSSSFAPHQTTASSIWSTSTANQDHQPQQQMQQLAYELSMFNLNPSQFQNEQDYEYYKSEMASTANALLAAAVNGGSSLSDDENGENQLALLARRRSQNTTECVPVPSSEHVAEIVGRQGCKIKALRAKTNTYIKTPVRGEEPVFVVTGRRDDVEAAKREILSAADHFTQIRASRRHSQGVVPAPGHVTAYVRVPYKVVGLVVGPKGATIKRVQQQTHTYIITPSREKDPVFEVTGLPENVEVARKEIETHIANRTGVYPATTIGGGPQSFGSDQDDQETKDNDFHLNGVDTTLVPSDTTTPDSILNGGSLFSIGSSINNLEMRRDSTNSQPPYFTANARALSLSSACHNPFTITNLEQRRASADAYFLSSSNNNNNVYNNTDTQQFNAWAAFVNGNNGATKKNENGLPIFGVAKAANVIGSQMKSMLRSSHLAYSQSGSEQDEGVWSVGGESPNSMTVEPLASSCLGSIWSEVVGV